MPNYTITISNLYEKGLVYKSIKLGKTKAQLFEDFVVNGILNAWVREMLDNENTKIAQAYELADDTKKNQVKTILGV